MDERIIPAIVLLLNFVFSIFGVFLTEFSAFYAIWGIVSMLSIALVALLAYENAKKIEFIEERIWKRFSELEESEKIIRRNIEDLKRVLEAEKGSD